MNQINQVLKLQKADCGPVAEKLFAKTGGMNKEGEKFDRMRDEAQEMRQAVDDRIDGKAVYSYYETVSLEGNKAIIGGEEFTCNAFELVDKNTIKGAYVYVVTAGDFEFEEEPIMRQLYADMWGTAFTDAARMHFSSVLKKNGNLSNGFGPGFYGMDVAQMHELTKLVDVDLIDVEVKSSGCLVPLKSCGGIYFDVTDDYIKLDRECEDCKGNLSSCQFCSVRAEKQKTFKCTGICSECGRCQGAKMIEGANKRKTKLLILPKDFKPEMDENGMGISFDIGTTTVVGTLWDIGQGRQLGSVARTNPQNAHGLDVISRITYCDEAPENLVSMQEEIVGCLNEIIVKLCEDNEVSPKGIIRVVVAGNTTMSHIFAGYSPATLARVPFEPAYTGEIMRKGQETGLNISATGDVFLVPNIAGHVGGDITAGVIASRLLEQEGLTLFIDIGTNGEIVLTDGQKTLACSTAAGPAFEGAAIYQGMRAAPGAIENIKMTDGDVEFLTIDSAEPVGICGSGLIDAIAQMLDAGVVNKTGRILSAADMEKKHPDSNLIHRLRDGEAGREFVLVFKEGKEDLVITQKDVREVQLAKGAIAAGISIMLAEMEADVAKIDRVIIAGAFGNFINKESAVRIGLLPEVEPVKIESAGNTAGAGALMVLASADEALLAKKIPELIEHIELASCADFQDQYMNAMSFR